MTIDLHKLRRQKLSAAAAVETARFSADPMARLDSRRRDMGMVQLGRIYIYHETLDELKWLQLEWGMTNQSGVVDIAIRRLHQQTKEGLQRLDFADGLPTKG